MEDQERRETEAGAKEGNLAPAQKIYSILAIDDERFITTFIKSTFEQAGFVVYVTINPESAINFVKAHKPSVIVLDLHIPAMDGFVLYEKIKAIDPKARFIVFTAYSDLHEEELKKLGVRVVRKSATALLPLEHAIRQELKISQIEAERLARKEKELSKLRILVLDDETEIADFYRDLFASYGDEAESAYDPKQALDIIKDFEPNVLLTDLKMTSQDGDEFVTQLMKLKTSVQVFVGMTGFAEAQDRFIKAGMNEFLLKPITIEDVENLRKKLLVRLTD